MKIAMIAPPWLPVPPPQYGGTESVVDMLSRSLVLLGHDVVLYARAGSQCPIEVRSPGEGVPWNSGTLAIEATWACDVYTDIERERFDIVHDHTIVGAVQGRGAGVPVVTTVHWPFTSELAHFTKRLAERTPLIAISHTQAASAPIVSVATVIHHGIDVESVPVGTGDGGYFVFLGRMVAEKGADIAARLARENGFKLLMATRLQEDREKKFFEERVTPFLGGGVEYVGEVGGAEKFDLLGGASALLNPIRWKEPFGMVMIEALACGTPVVASANGAATEIVEDGRTGFLCHDENQILDACKRIETIVRAGCREAVEASFSARRMARDHIRFYESVLATSPVELPSQGGGGKVYKGK